MTIDQKALAAARKAYAKRWMPNDTAEFSSQAAAQVDYIVRSYVEALPAPEPVAWQKVYDAARSALPDDVRWMLGDSEIAGMLANALALLPLYPSPPSHQGLREALEEFSGSTLSDEQIGQWAQGLGFAEDHPSKSMAREIEHWSSIMSPSRDITWGDVFNQHLRRGEDHGSAAYAADQWEKRQDATRWKHCSSTHCERSGECRSPSDCAASGRIARARAALQSQPAPSGETK